MSDNTPSRPRATEVKTIHTDENYLDENRPDAFLDFPEVQEPPPGRALCPRCQGHGGWNLEINAFPMPPSQPDTPENRHIFVHFRAICSNCNDQGHVPETQRDHIHRWETVRWANMVREVTCQGCGSSRKIDTSG